MVALGKKPGSGTKNVKAVVERLGLDTSHFAHRRHSGRYRRQRRRSTESHAWWAQRAEHRSSVVYRQRDNVAVPLESVLHDLITESDAGLKRVQVKTTQQRKAS